MADTTPPTDFYDPEYLKNARKSQWYDEVTKNLTKCPLCDLKAKYIIHELKHATLTVNLFPYIDGHSMVIPQRHVERLSDFTKEEWDDFYTLINLGMKTIRRWLGIENINVLYREGKGAGTSLTHAHIHLLPITPEFLVYDKQKFIMEFQDIKYPPHEEAEMLRKTATEILKEEA